MIKRRKLILSALLGTVLSAFVIMAPAAKPAGPETTTDKKHEQEREEAAKQEVAPAEAEESEHRHRFVRVLDILEEQGLLYSIDEPSYPESKETSDVDVNSGLTVQETLEDSADKETAGIPEVVAEDTSAIADAKEALLGFGLEESAGDSTPAENSESAENIVPPEDSTPAEVTEPVVVDETGEGDEGTISVPDHPIAQTAERMVFIGDSRTVDMMNAVHDGSVWACKVSMGYQWMATVGVPAVDGYIDAGTAVIILMGVNDPYNISNYIGYTNEKAAEWAARGATTYFVSVGPVDGDPYVTNAEIESFNAALQANLSGVYYIDIYSYLMANGFSTVDGTHYPDNVSIAIYNYIVEHLEVNRTGIWG